MKRIEFMPKRPAEEKEPEIKTEGHGFSWEQRGPLKELDENMFRNFMIKYGIEDEKDIEFLWKTRPEYLNGLIKESDGYNKREVAEALRNLALQFKKKKNIDEAKKAS